MSSSVIINRKSFLCKIKNIHPCLDSVLVRFCLISTLLFEFFLQADVCHAYQVLKKGGLQDENIIVFMYDDIANNEDNPRPGVIINDPRGEDVYAGVPKVFSFSHLYLQFLSIIMGSCLTLE